MKNNKQHQKTTIQEVKPYQIININQINSKNSLFKFCGFIAKRNQVEKIVVYPPGSEFNFPEKEFSEIIPLLTNVDTLIKSDDINNWLKLSKLIESVPFVVLFIPQHDLINLNNEEKQEILTQIKNTFINHDILIDQIGYIHQLYGDSGIIILLSNGSQIIPKPPEIFRVIAIIAVRNEVDIIKQTIEYLVNQGIHIYIIDDWSTDGSYEISQTFLGKGVIGLERWPKSSPSKYFDLQSQLLRKEELAQELNADWFMHCGTDEYRESPWKEITLRDAFWKVDQMGFNAIDFTVLNFFPTDDNYSNHDNPINYFRYCEFGDRPGHFRQINAWKKQPGKVDLHTKAGHIVQFNNLSVFPYKFLLRHYSFRNKTQAHNKLNKERLERLDPEALKRGWHSHYKEIDVDNIIKNKKDLVNFNNYFYSNYLVERLSGIGIESLEPKSSNSKNTPKVRDKNNLQNNTDSENQLRRLRQINQKKTNEINQLQKEIASLTKEIETAQTEIFTLKQQVQFYAESKSWKLTRPLRDIMDILRKNLK